MIRTILISLFLCQVYGQSETYDLRDQISLVKEIYPDVQVIGLFIGSKDVKLFEETIGTLQRDFQIRIALAVITMPRKRDMHYLESLYKDLTLDMLNKSVGVVMFGFGRDKSIKTAGAAKVVSSLCSKFDVPVFSPHKKAIKNGCIGQFKFEGEWWRLQLNRNKIEKFSISIPKGDDRFLLLD